jgi:aryl-alcohol dehydrogenase-like predicted oxidoreductase
LPTRLSFAGGFEDGDAGGVAGGRDGGEQASEAGEGEHGPELPEWYLGAMQRRLLGLNDAGLARTRPLIGELRAIAHAYGATPGQVALAWLVQFYGDTVVAIPGASKPHQAEQSAAAMNLHLTDKELARIDELSRKAGAS